MLSFIHVDFAVHKVFKWLSQNKGNAFNIEAFDLFWVLIISLGFHYAASLIPSFFFHFSSFPWYFILIFRNYFYVTVYKYYIIVILTFNLSLYLSMIL